MEAHKEGLPLPPLRSRKGMYALALLALRHDRDVPRSYLAGLLWPDSLEEQALSSLRRTLTDLRQAFGDYADCLLSPTSRTLRLDFTRIAADVIAFDRDVVSAQEEALERAVNLYRGPLLEGCLEEWVLQEREAREEAYLSALEKLARFAGERGDLMTAENRLARVIRVRPWRETAQRTRMETLAALGNYAAITLAYRDLRHYLRDSLNAEPDAETTALYQRLRVQARRHAAAIVSDAPQTADVDADETSDPEIPPPALHNLRLPLTPLIGRSAEKREIQSGLEGTRLVSLVGTGGVGKTRLATEIAWSVVEDYPGGVRFVDLSVITDGEMILPMVAAAFDVREQAGSSLPEALIERLGNRPALLMLDNCEHLLDDSAKLVEQLLSRRPHLHILVTSRQGLGLPGEKIVALRPLPLPPAHPGAALPVALLLKYDCIRLFVQRASAIGAFRFDQNNAADILRICQQLDGLPLAVELAAARTKGLTVSQIAQRLGQGVRILDDAHRTAQPRQKTLHTLLDWSYDLLSPGERTLLRRLTIFVGGWTGEAAEVICADEDLSATDIPGLLASLVEKSLVFVEKDQREERYRMLETVRHYGQEKMAAEEAERIAAQRRDWFLELAEAAHPHLDGPDYAVWLDRLESERGNLRQALKWTVERDTRLRFAYALSSFWLRRGYLSEGRAWLEGSLLLNRGVPPSARNARILQTAGVFAWTQGDFDAAQRHWREALLQYRALNDQTGIAYLQIALGLLAQEQGDYDTAMQFFGDSQTFFEKKQDVRGALMALTNLGVALCAQGRYAEARRRHKEALAQSERMSDARGIITALGNLAEVAYAEGDDVTAGELWTQCLRRDREMNYPWGIANSLVNLGDVARRRGNREAAYSLYRDSLRRGRRLAEKRITLHALEGLAMTRAGDTATGDNPKRAVHLHSAAARMRSVLQMPLPSSYGNEVLTSVARLRQIFDEKTFASFWEEGANQNGEMLIESELTF